MLPPIQLLLQDFQKKELKEASEQLDTLEDIFELINTSTEEDPPLSIKEGGFIKQGYSEEVDALRKAKTEGKDWLAKLEAKEREATGIKNLRVKFNKVFGYYLEVTNSYKDLVPMHWVRKQTLSNAERYTTDELKKLEDTILGAEDKLFALEYELFCEIRDTIASKIERIQRTAKLVAKIDVYASLALVAERNNYVRPLINTKGVIQRLIHTCTIRTSWDADCTPRFVVRGCVGLFCFACA